MKYKLENGNELHLIQDTAAQSPDDWGNEDCFIVYEHRSFTVRRDGFPPRDIYDSLRDDERTDYKDEYDIFLLYAYIHGGVHLSLEHNGDLWDTSSTGYVLVKKELVPDPEQAARSLIETWNQCLSGDVYGFKEVKKTKCEHCGHIEEEEIDACWGFYGSDPKTNGMLDHIDSKIVEECTL